MLELRPTCENCNAQLPPESREAWICSFECTFCTNCVEHILNGICPNCNGTFERRPLRPSAMLIKYPASAKITFNPLDR